MRHTPQFSFFNQKKIYRYKFVGNVSLRSRINDFFCGQIHLAAPWPQKTWDILGQPAALGKVKGPETPLALPVTRTECAICPEPALGGMEYRYAYSTGSVRDVLYW